MELKIGNIPITSVKERPARFTGLLWGSSGCGKTTLACTAPGKKLLINFDPDGPASVAARPDVDVADFSREANNITELFKKDDILGLSAVIENYDTIISDSLTNATYMALMHGIPQTKGAKIERPSPGAYMVRNALTIQLVKRMLRLTGKHGKHCIFIAHEGAPVTNEEGIVLHITLMLGGQLPQQGSVDMSEVWAVSDTGRQRRIAIRPVRMRQPCKTRMFATTGSPEFDWKFNPETWEGHKIETWWQQWIDGGKEKLPLPK